MSAPEATSDSNFLYFLSDLLKYSEHVRMKYAQKHFKSTGSAYFNSNKTKLKLTKLKLAKKAEKEPRKASFPWNIGLIFVQPTKMH